MKRKEVLCGIAEGDSVLEEVVVVEGEGVADVPCSIDRELVDAYDLRKTIRQAARRAEPKRCGTFARCSARGYASAVWQVLTLPYK